MTAQAIQPIEIEVYKPHPTKPGYVTLDHRRGIREIRRELNAKIPEDISRELEYPFHDYVDWDDEPFPEFDFLACFALPGANEGYYVHVEALKRGDYGADKRQLVYLAKCWDWDLAWRLVRVVADLLVKD